MLCFCRESENKVDCLFGESAGSHFNNINNSIIDSLLPNQATFWLMEGVLECYIQEKPSGEENLQALVSLLLDAGTANCVPDDYDSFLLNSTRSISHVAGGRWENSRALIFAVWLIELNIEFNDSNSMRVYPIICVKISEV